MVSIVLAAFIGLTILSYGVYVALAAPLLFWRTDGTSGQTWTGTNWSNPASATGGTAWTLGDDAEFSADSSLTFATTTVGNVTVDSGKTVTVVAGGTLSLGGAVRTFDIGSGATLTWTSQTVTANSAAGITKNGAGTLSLGALTFSTNMNGGFTLNNGTVVVSGAKALGNGSLTINAGTLQSTNSNTFTPTTVVIGGDFSFAGTGNDIWNQTVDLGSSTRTITNTTTSTATRTFSGVISGGSDAGLTFTGTGGSGGIVLSGANTYSGDTTISGGKLALSGAGSIANSPNIVVAGGATFDVSGLTTALTLSSGQGLKATGTTSAGTIATASGKGLTTASNSPIQFTAYNGANAPLTVSGAGSVTLQSGNLATITISNGGTPLTVGDHKLISKGTSGVAGTAPTSVTVNGDGIASGTTATLRIISQELFLHIALNKYRSKQSGNWNDFNTWQIDNTGDGFVDAASGQTPTNVDDTIQIQSGHTVTVTASVHADQLTVNSSGQLTVNNGVTLTLDDGSGTDLTVNGTAVVNATGVISGAGSLTLSSGATLEVDSTDGIDSGTSAGNIRVSGTRTFNSGANYNFNGSGAQVTGSGFPTIVSGLTISNSAGVTLSADTTVDGVLALTSGDITTSTHTLIMGVGAPDSTGSGDVVGKVNRTDVTNGQKRTFGNPDVQITSTGAGTITSMTISLSKGAAPGDFTSAIQRIYTITANGGTALAATLRLRYLQTELNSNAEDATLNLWRNPATWTLEGRTSNDGSANWVEKLAVVFTNALAEQWVMASSSPTDVAMMNAKATRYEKHVLLEWQTGYEVSNIGFNIYREKNGNLERITPEPVAGSALIAGPRVELKAGLAYSWWDDEEIAECGNRNAECENRRYWIEDIDLSGKTTTHGPFGVSDAAPDDPLADQHRDQAMILTHRSRLLSALGRDASLAQTAEAATVPVEPVAKVTKLTAARMSIQSGVASQPAVKMSIQRAGWYRVEQADLVAAGLPGSADPTMLQLFADGREVPMLVFDPSGTFKTTGGAVIVGGGNNNGGGATGGGATGGGATGGGATGGGVSGGKTATWNAIQFYGVGIDSPSTVNHVYWLVVGGQPGLRIGTSSAKGGPPAPSSFAYTVERRDRSLYFPALKNGGAEKWFGPLVYNAQPVDQSVTLQHVTAPGSATMLVSLQGFTNTAHSVRVLFNGVEVGTMRFNGLQKSSNKFVIPASNVREGVNQIQLIGPAGTSDMSLVDFVQVTYAHSMTADTNALRIPVSGQQSVTIDGFTSSLVRVVDVTDASSPVELQTTVNNSATSKTSSTYSVTATAPGSGTRVLLAFASDQQKRPAQIAANQPSSYRDPSQRADYLVLTRKDLLGSFNTLTDLRKNQGLTPLVIDVEDIYDEFNFGNKSPQAIKDFLSYAKTSWARAPRFVVLGGDATYDPKNYLGTGDFDLVPTRLVETAYNEAATDDWFVDVNGDAVPDMAIGRLPVRTASEATALVMKLVSYDSSAASNNVLLVADRNSSFDFEGADTQLRSLIPASMTVTDIRRGQVGDANARSQLLAAFNQGAKIVNFYGHGSTTVWTDAPILSASDAARLTNTDHLSLVVSMTCLNAYFVTSSIESLGESLLKSQGGAIAVWASSGLTDANAQTVMSRDAISRLFGGANLTIGEVVALSKASVTNMDVRRTWILLGDPATRLR